jgi:hypothetical protein
MTSRKRVATATSKMMVWPDVDLSSPNSKPSGIIGSTERMGPDDSRAQITRCPRFLGIDQPHASNQLRRGMSFAAMVVVGMIMLYGPSPALAQLSSFGAPGGSTGTDAGATDGIPSINIGTAAAGSAREPVDFHSHVLPYQVPGIGGASGLTRERSGVHWLSLIGEEFLYMTFKTGDRAFQAKTRDNFGGPFFKDWGYIVQHINVDRWSDGGKWFTNNVGHPMDGSIYAFIYRRNDDNTRYLRFDLHDPEYRKGILKAFLVASVASTESEIGPLSEATIGHVGLKAGWYLRGANGVLTGPVPQDVIGLPTLTKSPYWVRGGNGTGLTDFIMTPFGGVALMLGEDAVDKYVIERLEQHIHNRYWVATIRCLLSPTRSAGNFFSFASPWHRDNR